MEHDSNHPNSLIQQKLQAIYSLHTKKMDFRLDQGPYRDLLTNLGNPHMHLPPVIHVAGTNGKGSVIAFLKSLLEARSASVHVYTSPHLIRFNERIVLNGQQIADDKLDHYLDKIAQMNADAPITFFEYTTAMAFQAFADHPADFVLLETGLGGRLDCTNVIENPVATVITSIGYDHMDWLGHDLSSIAAEKAGIMKAGVPCVIAPQSYADQVNEVFEAKARQLGCPLSFVKRIQDLPSLGLIGDHQKDNASTALAVLNILSGKPADNNDAINDKALQQVQWPARMEQMSADPEIWFDCGHNADGAKIIARQLQTWKAQVPNRPIHLILGLAADKNPNDFMAPLWAYCDRLTCVDLINARNPQTAADLSALILPPNGTSKTFQGIQCFDTLNQAVASAMEKARAGQANTPAPLTLITGSLYLYAEAIKAVSNKK